MDLPFGKIDGKNLEIRFSTADFSVATVVAGIREHLDMFEEMAVQFLGVATNVPGGQQPVFRPIDIVAKFEYVGEGDAKPTLNRIYCVTWHGVINNFPDEIEWAEAKSNYADFVVAQAEMLRAQTESK